MARIPCCSVRETTPSTGRLLKGQRRKAFVGQDRDYKLTVRQNAYNSTEVPTRGHPEQ
jgi:hypothetical protein